MAEMLVRVTDKVNADFYLNCRCSKRGDVIVVRPDGWAWSSAERTNPEWRIVRVALAMTEAEAWCASELETNPQNPSRTLQRRAFKMNVDAGTLPAAFRTWLQTNSRVTPMMQLSQTLTQIRALKVARPPIVDPGVIG